MEWFRAAAEKYVLNIGNKNDKKEAFVFQKVCRKQNYTPFILKQQINKLEKIQVIINNNKTFK